MALFKCPDCEGEVSVSALACPHCGYSQSGSTERSGMGGFLAVILSILASIFCVTQIDDFFGMHSFNTFGDRVHITEATYTFIWLAIGVCFACGIRSMVVKGRVRPFAESEESEAPYNEVAEDAEPEELEVPYNPPAVTKGSVVEFIVVLAICAIAAVAIVQILFS